MRVVNKDKTQNENEGAFVGQPNITILPFQINKWVDNMLRNRNPQSDRWMEIERRGIHQI